MGVYSDDKAEKSAQSAKQEAEKKEKKKPVGSEFYNTLACLVGDYFMKIGATSRHVTGKQRMHMRTWISQDTTTDFSATNMI